MRFWLRWAIVTLPLIVCSFLWIRSYAVEEVFNRDAYQSELTAGISQGRIFVAFLRARNWSLAAGHWSYQRYDHSVRDASYFDPGSFLGFGFGSQPGPAGASATFGEFPMWAMMLLFLLPPL